MLGRRTKTVVETPGTAAPPRPGKGRPTPRRSEAERQRRRRVNPPQSRREAYRQQRDEARAARQRQRQALASGDPRYLPRRDQGPVRGYVRDFVDSRRTVGEYFLLLALGVLVASLLPVAAVRLAAFYTWSVMLVVIIVDSIVLGTRLRKALRTRFSDEERRGAVAYGVLRSTQMRRLRLPPPRVRPGHAL